LKQEKMTRFFKPAESDQKWFVVDAKDQVVGRLAAKVASIIRGKCKPQFTTNMDAGDFVIVINADKIAMATKREEQKKYFTYSGYPGGAKFKSVAEVRAKKPEYIVEHAVRGMLPKTKLGDKLIKKLKVYPGEAHPHAAQKPETLSL